MAVLGLVFDEAAELLYCGSCKETVGRKFEDHLRNRHQMKVPNWAKSLIQDKYFGPATGLCVGSPYRSVDKKRVLLPALDFRPVEKGWRCSGCGLASKKKKYIASHACPGELSIEKCQVQNLGSASLFSSFFGIDSSSLPASPLPKAPRIQLPAFDVLGAFHAANDGVNGLAAAVEVPRFLQSHGMSSVPPKDILDALLPTQEALAEADHDPDASGDDDGDQPEDEAEGEEEGLPEGFEAEAVSWASDQLERVKEWPVGDCYLLRQRKPFNPLQTRASRRAYARTFGQFMVFLWNYAQSTMQGSLAIPYSQPLDAGICRMVLQDNAHQFTEIILAILGMDLAKVQGRDPLTLFVWLRFFRYQKGVRLSAAYIEQLAAKVVLLSLIIL